MAPLEPRWFTGEEGVPELFAENLEVASFGYPVAAVLGKNGWDGELVVSVGLELSPDNRRVARGQVVMRGALSKEPAILQAHKLWETADKEVAAHITFPQAAEFDFANGTLTSEYLTSAGIKVVISKNDQVVMPTDWKAHGVGNFCLRLVLNVAKPAASNGQKPAIKFSLLFFPHTHQEMLEWSDIVNEPGWPGVKILEGKAQLFPAAPTGSWGCPIYPLFCTGSRFETAPNLPSPAEMRFVIASIMLTARAPNSYSSHSTLKRKWGKILADGDEYVERLPLTTWPPAPSPPVTMGKHKIYPYHTHTHTNTTQ